MKNIITIGILLFLISNISAQTEKDKLIVSGSSNLSFSSTKYHTEIDGEDYGDEIKITEFNLTPSVGYFVRKNLALGLSLEIESYKYDDDYNENSLLIGPFVRYIFKGKKLRPYVQSDILFGNMNSDIDDEDYKYNVTAWDLGAGVNLFITDFISLDLGLGYVSAIYKLDDDDYKEKATGFVLNAGISFFL